MLRTSDGRLAVIMITFLMYMATPVIFGIRLREHGASGSGGPILQADPGLTYLAFMLLWLLALPFVVIFCGLTEMLGRKYYGSDI